MDYTVNGETTEYMVLGLSAGVVYHFQISARDSVSETAGGGGWIIGPEIDTSL